MTSIYYQANRNYPLTQSEQEKIDQILKECEENYPFREEARRCASTPMIRLNPHASFLVLSSFHIRVMMVMI